ncbi:hypothetical protein DsansV1_C08g0077951 [Dioscorea sansibarensis]
MPGRRGERPYGRPNRAGQNPGDDRGFWVSLLMFFQMFGDFIVLLLPRRGVPQQVPVRMVAGREEHRQQPQAVVFRRHQLAFLDRIANSVRITLLTIFLSQQDARGRILSIIGLGFLVLLYRVGVIPPFPWFAQDWVPPVDLWPAVEPDDRNEHLGEGIVEVAGENPGREE